MSVTFYICLEDFSSNNQPFLFLYDDSFSYSQYEPTEVLLLCETLLNGLNCILTVLLITDVNNLQVGWSQIRKWKN